MLAMRFTELAGTAASFAAGAIIGPLATYLFERRRSVRVESDDLKQLSADPELWDPVWVQGLRWAAERGDVSDAVRQQAPWLHGANVRRKPWIALSSLAAGASSAWRFASVLSPHALRPVSLLLATILTCTACACAVSTALMDSWHHEIERTALALSFGSSLLASSIIRASLDSLLAGAAGLGLGLEASRVVRRLRPKAMGEGDMLLAGCLFGLICASADAGPALCALAISSATVAFLGSDPDFPDRIPCAPVLLCCALLA